MSNGQIAIFSSQILVLFALLAFLTIFMVVANIIWTKVNSKNMWYLAGVGTSFYLIYKPTESLKDSH